MTANWTGRYYPPMLATGDGRSAGKTPGPGWPPALALVLTILGAVAVPLLVSARYGALGIPRGDDWSYIITMFRLVDTGHLSFNHWVSMSLVGQLAIAAPVVALAGHSITALQVSTAVIGAAGLAALAASARRLGIPMGATFLIVVSLASGPLWGPLAATFMTDVPAFAVTSISTWLAVIAFRRDPVSPGLVVTSVLVGLGAFAIRQYTIVTVIAVLATTIACARADDDLVAERRWWITALLTAIFGLAFMAWWHTIPDGRQLAPAVPDAHAIRLALVKSSGFVRLVALLTLPVLLWVSPVRIVKRSFASSRILTIVIALGGALWLGLTAVRSRHDVFVGNYLMQDGALSNIVVAGRRSDVLPAPVWSALIVITCVAGTILLVATVPCLYSLTRVRGSGQRRGRSPLQPSWRSPPSGTRPCT